MIHNPERPSWRCAADGRTWPCELARKQIEAAIASVAYQQIHAVFATATSGMRAKDVCLAPLSASQGAVLV